mmetsp:Transcript_25022/g.38568  ORF Transcript_25022/g.38568 Transcript_25022/m.38568 type:complete len:204 (+) Transcript_25022:318-929(+)|eukprot:CAMPEP_0195301986 /NCGR_PEP_ID=MMETSP0707-20130614/30298_1 /TAXON_ID=33640 /ORGANISM="Asterionellopsis glacialis, Strain CCMP134" /LENGTH=203 /DNA_ID=CAMNT_0040365107 /DNA_START=250 /DNA_END=861 /DNA_ORIENTATION=+
MSLRSVAIVGKNNKPLYIREIGTNDDGGDFTEDDLFGISSHESSGSENNNDIPNNSATCLKQQFILHSALDRFEELAGPLPGYGWRKPGSTGTDAMWVGLLCPVEDMRVYGYWTSTKIKFILVIQDGIDLLPPNNQQQPPLNQYQLNETQDSLLQSFVVDLHKLYVEHTMNPFYALDAPIDSMNFDQSVTQLVDSYHAKQQST